MRELTDHKVNPANDLLKIEVLDEAGSGGASHAYQISGYSTATNPSCPFMQIDSTPETDTVLTFQNGPIGDAGVNGLTHEALLAILVDRMRGFQSGPYSTRENAVALTKLEEAQMWLHKRTRERLSRGVEGTHEK